MTGIHTNRLDGLEPDNVLAFLALLGLLRALNAVDLSLEEADQLRARADWDIDHPPIRPRLWTSRAASADELLNQAAKGVDLLSDDYGVIDRKDLKYTRAESHSLLREAAHASGAADRGKADLLAALMTDGAIKDEKEDVVDHTPMCLMFGQGHQHFLERLAAVPKQKAPPPRGRGKNVVTISAADCLGEALLQRWHRDDPTSSFRWDPAEDVRYALMAGDPTDPAHKSGTQHGANRLAAIGLTTLSVVPQARSTRTRATVVGGHTDRIGFSFAWPIWRGPASLPAIKSLLAHPDLRAPGALSNFGVVQVLVARRISVGKFMNFERGRILEPKST